MNRRELQRLAAAAEEAPTVVVPSGWVKDLVAVAVAAQTHVEERGAWRTDLGRAVEQLQKGNGQS